MPPKLKHLSGREVITALGCFGFLICSQRGSHVKLQRISKQGFKQSLTIPNHREIDLGTLRAIIRQASRFVPELELKPYFYTKD